MYVWRRAVTTITTSALRMAGALRRGGWSMSSPRVGMISTCLQVSSPCRGALGARIARRDRRSRSFFDSTTGIPIQRSSLEDCESMIQDLGGKVAVVTGAASGIGLALATRWVDEGMRVVLADRD